MIWQLCTKQKLSINRPDNLLTTLCPLVFSVFVCSGHGLVSMAEKRDGYRRRLERWAAQNLGHWVRDVCDRCRHQLTGVDFYRGDVIVLLIMTNHSNLSISQVCSLRWAERKRSLITGHGLPQHHIACWNWDSTSLLPTHQLTGERRWTVVTMAWRSSWIVLTTGILNPTPQLWEIQSFCSFLYMETVNEI